MFWLDHTAVGRTTPFGFIIFARSRREIRDKTEVFQMKVREVEEDAERKRLWDMSSAAFPPYNEYQAKTDRKIPIFIAEPV